MAARDASGVTSTPTRRARSTQAAATSSDGDPRAVVRALKREFSRLQAADSKLTEAELSLDGLRRERPGGARGHVDHVDVVVARGLDV